MVTIGLDEYSFEVEPTPPATPLQIPGKDLYHRKVTVKRVSDGDERVGYSHLTGRQVGSQVDILKGRLENILSSSDWGQVPSDFDMDAPELQKHYCYWCPKPE